MHVHILVYYMCTFSSLSPVSKNRHKLSPFLCCDVLVSRVITEITNIETEGGEDFPISFLFCTSTSLIIIRNDIYVSLRNVEQLAKGILTSYLYACPLESLDVPSGTSIHL